MLNLLVMESCHQENKNPLRLPSITEEGKNTFGCYIAGKLLVPRNGTGTFTGLDKGMIFTVAPDGYSYNEIIVHDYKSGTGGLITIHIDSLHEKGVGKYTINKSNCQTDIDAIKNVNVRCRWWDEDSKSYKWYCSTNNSGILNITRYDFAHRIISGTFNCMVKNKDNSNEMIEITEGRFDINWQTLIHTNFQ